MRVSTGYLNNLDVQQKLNEPWCGLVWIPFHIRGQIFHRLEAQLPTRTSTPRVDVPLNVYSDCVAISTRNLVYALVAQLHNFQGVWLEGVALAVLGHLGNDFT